MRYDIPGSRPAILGHRRRSLDSTALLQPRTPRVGACNCEPQLRRWEPEPCWSYTRISVQPSPASLYAGRR